MAATQTIPIVFTTATDPVANGLVARLDRPGGNATGVTWIASELIPKRFELLHEVVPAATKMAMLLGAHEDPPTARENVQGIQEAARRLAHKLNGASELPGALALGTAGVAKQEGQSAQVGALVERYGLEMLAQEQTGELAEEQDCDFAEERASNAA